jgi:5,10-methylenetetrahydromethanopterin reductase
MTTRVGLCFLDRPDLARCLRLVRMAEELGFSEAWVCETRLARDAISVLGAFAAVTGRIRLGTGIINSWTRAAPLTAMTFATLDELAPGRTMLGLGAYWDPLAWKQGITRRKPLSQMREYVEVVRRLLNLERFTFEGELVTVRDVQLDLGHGAERAPKPVPIYIGATGEQMLELTGEVADGALLNGITDVAYTRMAVERVAIGARRAGRDPADVDLPQLVNVSMDADRDRAYDIARRLITMYLGQQAHIARASRLSEDRLRAINEALGGWPPSEGGIERAMRLVDDSIVERLFAVGTPEDCRQAVQRYLDAGATCAVLVPTSENYEEIVEVFAPI